MASPPESAPSLPTMSSLNCRPYPVDGDPQPLSLSPSRERRQQPPSFPYSPKIEDVPVAEQEVLLLIAESKGHPADPKSAIIKYRNPQSRRVRRSHRGEPLRLSDDPRCHRLHLKGRQDGSRETAFAYPCCNCGLARAHRATVGCRQSVGWTSWERMDPPICEGAEPVPLPRINRASR